MNSATNYLCDEMLIEILGRLPVKSLVRFTAVCRRWKSIITGPQFRFVSSSTTKLLVHTDQGCLALEDENHLAVSEAAVFPFKHYLREAIVVGSDNGLVCIRIQNPSKELSPVNIIWNPSIRRHAVIPPKDFDFDGYFVSRGFGATISGNDYKYVRFLSFYDGVEDECLEVDIYSWKTGTWQRIYLDFDSYERTFFSSQIAASLRGRLHWAASDEHGKDIVINSISAFDLEDEVFDQDIMLPECFSSHIDFFSRVNVFVTKESQLAMIVNEEEPNRAMHCSVWVMQEYGDVNSWTKLFRLDLAAIEEVDRVLQDVDSCIREDSIHRVPNAMVHLLKNGELLLGLEVGAGEETFPPKLVKYNPKTSMATEICGVSSSSQLCGFTNYYKESLAFLAAQDDDRVHADHEVLSGRFGPSKRRKLKHQF